MALTSRLFSGDPQLEAAAISNPAHVTPGANGTHVAKIQAALLVLDGFEVERSERLSRTYGPSTAAGVLAYKTRRNIINRAYQTSADNVVGIMTTKAMDEELSALEVSPPPDQRPGCGRTGVGSPLVFASEISDDAFERGVLSVRGKRVLPIGLPAVDRPKR